MSRVCEVTGRRPVAGRSYTLRGIAKKKKGIGLKITGKNKRRFLPNLMKKRFWDPELKSFVTLNLSAQAMRTIDKQGITTVLRKMRTAGKKV